MAELTEEQYKQWKDNINNNPVHKKHVRVMNPLTVSIGMSIIIILSVALITFLFGFTYLMYKGYLKSDINQEVNLEPQINVTENTDVDIDDRDTHNNEFDFIFDIDKEIFERYCNSS